MFWAQLENQVWAKLGPEPQTRAQEPPNQARRFQNFFWGPILELFSVRFSSHVQEIPQIMSTLPTRRNLQHFQEMHQIMSAQTQTCRKKFRNGAPKKVPESASLVGDDLAVL